MRKASDFLSKPVISLKEGRNEGVIKNISFAAGLKAAEWLVLYDENDEDCDEKAVSLDNAYTLGENAVMIKSGQAVVPAVSAPLRENNPINCRIFTAGGRLLGIVSDVTLTDGNAVTALIYDKDKSLPLSEVLSGSRDIVVAHKGEVMAETLEAPVKKVPAPRPADIKRKVKALKGEKEAGDTAAKPESRAQAAAGTDAEPVAEPVITAQPVIPEPVAAQSIVTEPLTAESFPKEPVAAQSAKAAAADAEVKTPPVPETPAAVKEKPKAAGSEEKDTKQKDAPVKKKDRRTGAAKAHTAEIKQPVNDAGGNSAATIAEIKPAVTAEEIKYAVTVEEIRPAPANPIRAEEIIISPAAREAVAAPAAQAVITQLPQPKEEKAAEPAPDLGVAVPIKKNARPYIPQVTLKEPAAPETQQTLQTQEILRPQELSGLQPKIQAQALPETQPATQAVEMRISDEPPQLFAYDSGESIEIWPLELEHIPERIIASYAFLLGRRVGKNIYNASRQLVIQADTLVSPKTVETARKYGRLVDLTKLSNFNK